MKHEQQLGHGSSPPLAHTRHSTRLPSQERLLSATRGTQAKQVRDAMDTDSCSLAYVPFDWALNKHDKRAAPSPAPAVVLAAAAAPLPVRAHPSLPLRSRWTYGSTLPMTATRGLRGWETRVSVQVPLAAPAPLPTAPTSATPPPPTSAPPARMRPGGLERSLTRAAAAAGSPLRAPPPPPPPL
jgi:hypothetical protein